MSGSAALFQRALGSIAGGVVSLNRKTEPNLSFVRGQGGYLWDADEKRYIDLHAAFGPYLLGHSNPEVEEAVIAAIRAGHTLTGSGTTPWEIEAAELLRACVPTLDRVQFTNTGSEATGLAVRLARAFTGREHIVVMQGGYNGWQDEVACNVMSPLEQLAGDAADGEYPHRPMSAGIPHHVSAVVHVVPFNRPSALEAVLNRYPVACVLTEPILQNIGVVKPRPGYLAEVRRLCDAAGTVLIFDEVKTGFRHALAGYHSIAGVRPDLAVFGKAIANGYPVGAIGGIAPIMALFDDPDPNRRVLIAGTYNGHPVPMAAAIATMRLLLREGPALYERLESLGAWVAARMTESLHRRLGTGVVPRQGSAFSFYFCDSEPVDWVDLARRHDMARDVAVRRAMIDRGVYVFPVATKQLSLCTEHTTGDAEQIVFAFDSALEDTQP